MREYNDFKYAYLFGGGAIRGTAHVGVIKALEQIIKWKDDKYRKTINGMGWTSDW